MSGTHDHELICCLHLLLKLSHSSIHSHMKCRSVDLSLYPLIVYQLQLCRLNQTEPEHCIWKKREEYLLKLSDIEQCPLLLRQSCSLL